MAPLKDILHHLRRTFSKHRTGENTGLRVLADPEDAKIDIVAVHSLGGQGFSSWTTSESKDGKSKPWLQELLSADMPNARIMTYCYIPDGTSPTYAVRNIGYSCAFRLANALATRRHQDKTSRRPLFFIAHSLGGWIVKRALIISSEAAYVKLKDIELSTCGVVFFGTLSPGRPSSPSPLAHVIRRTTSSFADCDTSRADKESESSPQQPPSGDIEWLEHQMEAFKAIAAILPTLSFYETKKT